MEIIDELTITIGISLDKFKQHNKKPENIMDAFFMLTSSDRNLARIGLTLNFRNMNQEVGLFPEQLNKELARILIQGSKEAFLGNPTLTKVLNEFVNVGILEPIKTKKEIKNKSPKSISRKPKAGEGRRVGYPIIYKLEGTIEDYKKILSNPQAVSLIHERLLKHGILREAYDLFSKNVFYVFKKGDKKLYDFLKMFSELFPNIDRNTIPDSDLFQQAINLAGEEELEELRKVMVRYLLENPYASIFFIFSLSKFKGNNN